MFEQTYVALAVGGTFFAILLVGVAVSAASRTRRSTQVLQGQLESAGVGVPYDRSGTGFSERVVGPAVARVTKPAGGEPPGRRSLLDPPSRVRWVRRSSRVARSEGGEAAGRDPQEPRRHYRPPD